MLAEQAGEVQVGFLDYLVIGLFVLAHNRRGNAVSGLEVPYTPASRAARHGELLVSANGSPLGTVSKNRLKIGRLNAATSVEVELETGAVDLGAAKAVEALSDVERQEAFHKLQDMQAHIASLMTQLQ